MESMARHDEAGVIWRWLRMSKGHFSVFLFCLLSIDRSMPRCQTLDMIIIVEEGSPASTRSSVLQESRMMVQGIEQFRLRP